MFGARSAARPPRVAPMVAGGGTADAGELGDILRRLAGDLEEQTLRLKDEAVTLRSDTAKATKGLHEALQQAAEVIGERSAEEVDREVGPTIAEATAALTEQLRKLEVVATTLAGAVERLGALGPAVNRLQQLASQPQPEPVSGAVTGALADALGELTQQLSSVSAAVREQVEAAVAEALSADARQRDSATAQALGRLADEFILLRRQVRAAPGQAAPAKVSAKKKAPAKAPAKKAPAKKRSPRTDADAGA